MKKLIASFVIMFSFVTVIFAQSEKTLVKSITVESSSVIFDLPGEVTTTEWDKDYIRIKAIINMPNNNEEFLKRLLAVGRYEISTIIENETMIVKMPKVQKKVKVSGVELTEIFKFEISVPATLLIKKQQENL